MDPRVPVCQMYILDRVSDSTVARMRVLNELKRYESATPAKISVEGEARVLGANMTIAARGSSENRNETIRMATVSP